MHLALEHGESAVYSTPMLAWQGMMDHAFALNQLLEALMTIHILCFPMTARLDNA